MSRRRQLPAFTLLEVLVAVAVLALGITVLMQSQARSILMAQQARNLTVATQLARAKLYDCEVELLKRGFSVADFKEDGRFDDEGYDDFFWECHAYKPDLPVPDASDITEAAASASSSGSASDAAGGLGGLGDLGALTGGGADNPMAGLGMGMLAPVLGQISQVVGESIRELVVIIRWREGNVHEELRVATHLVDPSGVNALAQQIQQFSSGGIPGLPGLPGLPGAGGGDKSGGGGSSPTPNVPQPPPSNTPPRR